MKNTLNVEKVFDNFYLWTNLSKEIETTPKIGHTSQPYLLWELTFFSFSGSNIPDLFMILGLSCMLFIYKKVVKSIKKNIYIFFFENSLSLKII